MIHNQSDAGAQVTVPNSIFQTLCPACATSIPINAVRCECGHELGGYGSPLETSLRDEELYENYLAARAEQAQETVQTTARTLMEEQENEELKSALLLAKEVATSIEVDLALQREKVQKLRSLLPPPVSIAPQLEPARVEAAPVVVLAETKVEARTAHQQTAATLDMAAKPPFIEPSKPVEPVPEAAENAKLVESPIAVVNPTPLASIAKPVEHAAPVVLATPSSMFQKAATALSALKQAKAREGAQQLAALRAQIARQKKADQEQAEQEAAEQVRVQATFTPPTAFREEQAARAERAMQDHILNSKECPNCTSRLSLNVTRCQCGFAFASGDTELPSLTLCTGDFTALRNTFLADLRNRR